MRSSQAEERGVFLGIAGDGDDQVVEELAAPVNQVEVPVGDRIERTGVDGSDLFQCASAVNLRLAPESRARTWAPAQIEL